MKRPMIYSNQRFFVL